MRNSDLLWGMRSCLKERVTTFLPFILQAGVAKPFFSCQDLHPSFGLVINKHPQVYLPDQYM